MQSVTCTGTEKPEQARDSYTYKNTNQCNLQNGPNKQQYKTLQKPRLRERTDRAWFSRLLRHPVRKRNGYSYNPGARGCKNRDKIKQSTNSIVDTETDNMWLLVRKQKLSY